MEHLQGSRDRQRRAKSDTYYLALCGIALPFLGAYTFLLLQLMELDIQPDIKGVRKC